MHACGARTKLAAMPGPHFVVNPNSGGGRARALLPRLTAALKAVYPEHQVSLTQGHGDAVRLAREAADGGASAVVAVGGDGTLHEVVNGVVGASRAAPVALIPGGRGSDFARGTGIPHDLDACLELLAAPPRPIDVGRVRTPSATAHFINIADAGLGGFTVDTANRWRLPVSGQLTYFLASAWGLVSYSGSPMKLTFDDQRLEGRFLVVAVGNSSYFGGGMHVCPRARPDDGLFDVTVMEARGLLHLIRHLDGLYGGTLEGRPGMHAFRCRTLTLESPAPVPLDIDGERAEGVPITFEVLAGALPFHLPPR